MEDILAKVISVEEAIEQMKKEAKGLRLFIFSDFVKACNKVGIPQDKIEAIDAELSATYASRVFEEDQKTVEDQQLTSTDNE